MAQSIRRAVQPRVRELVEIRPFEDHGDIVVSPYGVLGKCIREYKRGEKASSVGSGTRYLETRNGVFIYEPLPDARHLAAALHFEVPTHSAQKVHAAIIQDESTFGSVQQRRQATSANEGWGAKIRRWLTG